MRNDGCFVLLPTPMIFPPSTVPSSGWGCDSSGFGAGAPFAAPGVAPGVVPGVEPSAAPGVAPGAVPAGGGGAGPLCGPKPNGVAPGTGAADTKLCNRLVCRTLPINCPFGPT